MISYLTIRTFASKLLGRPIRVHHGLQTILFRLPQQIEEIQSRQLLNVPNADDVILRFPWESRFSVLHDERILVGIEYFAILRIVRRVESKTLVIRKSFFAHRDSRVPV